MSRATAWWMITTILLSSSTVCVAQEPAIQESWISFSGIRIVTEDDRSGNLREVKEVTVTVHPTEEWKPPQHFVIRSPGDFFWVNEQPHSEIVEDRLLITTDRKILVFDLTTGDQIVDIAGSSKVVASEDGRRVAFETESSSVIQVLDVPTLQIEPVFPERSRIELTELGGLAFRVEEPEDRHSVGKLYFSPDDSRLFFFCTHPAGSPDAREKLHLAVVDLTHELDATHFAHRPFDWKWFIRPDVELGDQIPYFEVESLTWRSEGPILATPPPDAWWLKEEIVFYLPDPDRWWIPDEPELTCKLAGEDEQLERAFDGVIRISNLEPLDLLVELATEADEVEPLTLKEKPWATEGVTVDVKVVELVGIEPHEVRIDLHSRGGGRSLKRHHLHLELKIPVSEETWNAEFEEYLVGIKELALREGRLAELERLLAHAKPEALKEIRREQWMWNKPGRFEIRCTYRSNVQGNWSGVVEAPPLVLEIVDDGTVFDKMLPPDGEEP